MGMLNSQQQILRQHTEILNDNQRSIAKFLKEGAPARQEESLKRYKNRICSINTSLEIVRNYQKSRKNN
jgi:hypothetical protein